MTDSPVEKTPPFKAGDKVRVLSPTADRGKHGAVVEVLELLGDLVYRYRVRLEDGTSIKCFGFELDRIDSSSAPPARRDLAS
jgi:hypothetical protein